MLNQKGFKHALKLIEQGRVNIDQSWNFGTEDENRLLGDPPDYESYSRWFLGRDENINPETKGAWKYPFGKDGKVYRSALVAARQRAAQQKEHEIFDAAGKLLEQIDKTYYKREMLSVFLKSTHNIPDEIQILPYGYLETEKGMLFVDEEAIASIISFFNTQRNDIVIDYEHQTLSGGVAPAAGWIKKLIDKAKEGLWAKVEWTQRAREFLQNREYRYVSPVVLKRVKDNRPVRLLNVALTNSPAIDGLVPIVNKRQMEVNMDELLKLLRAKDNEEAMKKVKELVEGYKKNKAEMEELASFKKEVAKLFELGEEAKTNEVKAAVLALKQGAGNAEDLAKKVAILEERLKQKEAEELVETAMKEGKILPAQKEWATDYAKKDAEGFKVFVAKSPKIVEFGKTVDPEKSEGIDPVQMQVNKMLGIEKEVWEKYGGVKDEG